MRIDILEFHGSIQLEKFQDWLNFVEKVLEFKDVPLNKRVSLVATRLRGRASNWWQQLKMTKSRQGKNKIETWEKNEEAHVHDFPTTQITQGWFTNMSKT